MTRRRALVGGLLVLAGACSRAPAGVTESAAPPIASECESTDLSMCVESCHDSACVEWCAGEACAATITSLFSCTEEALRVSAERWNEQCRPVCSAQVVPPTEGPSFCADWRASYFAMTRWNQPPPPSTDDASPAMIGSISFATSMWLVGELSRRHDDPHAAALSDMIHSGGWPLGDIDSCIPLDASGLEFFITLELEPNGTVKATDVRGDPDGGDCVANAVASALTLPVRVARDYPQLEVRVLVKPLPTAEQ